MSLHLALFAQRSPQHLTFLCWLVGRQRAALTCCRPLGSCLPVEQPLLVLTGMCAHGQRPEWAHKWHCHPAETGFFAKNNASVAFLLWSSKNKVTNKWEEIR